MDPSSELRRTPSTTTSPPTRCMNQWPQGFENSVFHETTNCKVDGTTPLRQLFIGANLFRRIISYHLLSESGFTRVQRVIMINKRLPKHRIHTFTTDSCRSMRPYLSICITELILKAPPPSQWKVGRQLQVCFVRSDCGMQRIQFRCIPCIHLPPCQEKVRCQLV